MRSVNKRRWGYLSLAEMFAVWALILAWTQLQAGEMTAHEIAADPLPPAPDGTPAPAVDEAAAPAAGEVLVAELAAPSSGTALTQASPAGGAPGTSGMLTQDAPVSLGIAVETAPPTAQPGALPVAAERPVFHMATGIAIVEPAAAAAPVPLPEPEEQEEQEEELETEPPEDNWVWQTDESGNIIARIESPQVQVRVGETPVNIWGGMSVQDPDSLEEFRPLRDVQGQWGALTLYEDGSWNYVERDDHEPFQIGFSTETFTVYSFDGTQAQVVIWLQYDYIGDLLAA